MARPERFELPTYSSTRSNSWVLMAVLFNQTSLAGDLSLRGHFEMVCEGKLSKSFNNLLARCSGTGSITGRQPS